MWLVASIDKKLERTAVNCCQNLWTQLVRDILHLLEKSKGYGFGNHKRCSLLNFFFKKLKQMFAIYGEVESVRFRSAVGAF